MCFEVSPTTHLNGMDHFYIDLVEVSKQERTAIPSVPSSALRAAKRAPAFSRKCIEYFTSDWQHFKRHSIGLSTMPRDNVSATDIDGHPRLYAIDHNAGSAQAKGNHVRGIALKVPLPQGSIAVYTGARSGRSGASHTLCLFFLLLIRILLLPPFTNTPLSHLIFVLHSLFKSYWFLI